MKHILKTNIICIHKKYLLRLYSIIFYIKISGAENAYKDFNNNWSRIFNL